MSDDELDDMVENFPAPPEWYEEGDASEPYFTCPNCGSPYFGRDTGLLDGKVVALDTVRCHGSSSGPIIYGDHRGMCNWRGVWPASGAEGEKP